MDIPRGKSLPRLVSDLSQLSSHMMDSKEEEVCVSFPDFALPSPAAPQQYSKPTTRSRSKLLLIKEEQEEMQDARQDPSSIPDFPPPFRRTPKTRPVKSSWYNAIGAEQVLPISAHKKSSGRFHFEEWSSHAQSEIEHHASGRSGEMASLRQTPPSTSCVDSSECHEFGPEITTRMVANQCCVQRHQHCIGAGEIDAMSEAGSFEDHHQEQSFLPVGLNCSAFDLLVSAAIQVLSEGTHENEDENGVTGPSKRAHSEIKLHKNRSEAPYFLYGTSMILRKKVTRRARSALRRLNGSDSVSKSEAAEVFPAYGCTSKRRRTSDEKDESQKQEIARLKILEMPELRTVIGLDRNKAKSLSPEFSDTPSMQGALRSDVSEVLPAVHYVRRRRVSSGTSQEKDQEQGTSTMLVSDTSNIQVSEVTENGHSTGATDAAQLNDGVPVIRSLRGRSQVLPNKFSDSILQPWKRTPRRSIKGK